MGEQPALSGRVKSIPHDVLHTAILKPQFDYELAHLLPFYLLLEAVSAAVLSTLQRLLQTYDELNHCPLGAGAMAGLEYQWDRSRMAGALGFTSVVRSALTSVADRDWTLKISAEYAILGNALSRFCTDLSFWGSSECGFINLPDALVSISSAMPQKRNLTILERIRGETSHLAALHVDFMLGQRNTPFTNMVEVSKEAGRYALALFEHADRITTLLHLVIEHLAFDQDRMYQVCASQYFGGFALANALTMNDSIPYRQAQVIVGELIRDAIVNDIPPADLKLATLQSILARYGYRSGLSQEQLRLLFDVYANLQSKQTIGSTHPDQVLATLTEQRQAHTAIVAAWEARHRHVADALEGVGNLLGWSVQSSGRPE